MIMNSPLAVACVSDWGALMTMNVVLSTFLLPTLHLQTVSIPYHSPALSAQPKPRATSITLQGCPPMMAAGTFNSTDSSLSP